MQVFKNNVSLEATPTGDTHVTNKGYVDGAIEQEIANIRVVGGITKTLLYEGLITSTGTYNLNDSVKNYSFILVTIRMGNTSNKNNQTVLIDTNDITTTDGRNAWLADCISRYIGFNFTNGYKKITVNDITNETDTSIAITKIIGIN